MITAGQIEEILSLYAKHGWTLRRVLLSDTLRVHFNERLQDLFGGAEIVSTPLDALWFSRASRSAGGETWEIRHLSQTPFALVEVIAAGTSDETREKILTDTQTRLRDLTSKPR